MFLYTIQKFFYLSEILGMNEIMESGQFVSFGDIIVPRFMGTASEPGYLAPMLPIILYYYFNIYIREKNRRIFFPLLITLIMALLTFSSAVYVLVIITTVVFIFQNYKKSV